MKNEWACPRNIIKKSLALTDIEVRLDFIRLIWYLDEIWFPRNVIFNWSPIAFISICIILICYLEILIRMNIFIRSKTYIFHILNKIQFIFLTKNFESLKDWWFFSEWKLLLSACCCCISSNQFSKKFIPSLLVTLNFVFVQLCWMCIHESSVLANKT